MVEPVAHSIRPIGVRLTRKEGKNKGAAVAKLISMLGKVETIELVIHNSGLGNGVYGCWGEDATCALAKLGTVKHPTIGGPGTKYSALYVTREALQRCVAPPGLFCRMFT